MKTVRNQKGFTLLEILLVVAAIGILAGIVIIAINPSKQLGDTNNAQRQIDTNTIINAIYQYALDNNGSFPASIDSVVGTSQVLGTAGTGCDSVCGATTTVAACLDLSDVLVPTYIVGIPTDPQGAASSTDYYINKGDNNRLTVGACNPQESAVIEVTR